VPLTNYESHVKVAVSRRRSHHLGRRSPLASRASSKPDVKRYNRSSARGEEHLPRLARELRPPSDASYSTDRCRRPLLLDGLTRPFQEGRLDACIQACPSRPPAVRLRNPSSHRRRSVSTATTSPGFQLGASASRWAPFRLHGGCDAAPAFKQLYFDSKREEYRQKDPVGMPQASSATPSSTRYCPSQIDFDANIIALHLARPRRILTCQALVTPTRVLISASPPAARTPIESQNSYGKQLIGEVVRSSRDQISNPSGEGLTLISNNGIKWTPH
jgi:hypothetical protein